MNDTLDFTISKSFLGTSAQGITLHWMKYAYGNRIDTAITNAAQLLYYPQVLIASLQFDEISLEVARSRLIFQDRMALSKGTPSADTAIPKRVDFNFSLALSRDARKGKTFVWLNEVYADKSVDAVLDAVCMVYYPAALASNPCNSELALKEAERSRLRFDSIMTEAVLYASHTERFFENGADTEKPVFNQSAHVAPLPPSSAVALSRPVEAMDEQDDDFEPPIYDLEDFGN
ncbi:MAG: hypothetical protein HC852_20545 [Acaryochloridaceae cyanobacterium RU_4_10]|nr:hypothetical protein [Acaryochloridaceae cyanobacterium RU_4_10]